jgi:hypothetical protein
LGVAGAVDLPVQNWNPVYSIGYGSKLELGLAFDPSWIAGIGLSYFHYQGVNFSGQVINDDFRAIPMVRYYPISAGIRPYLTAGAGLAVQFSAALDGTEKDINLNPGGFLGAGLELRLGAQDSLFVEGDYNLILASSTLGQDAALFGGLRCGF